MGLDGPVPDCTTLDHRRRTVSVDTHAPARTAAVDLVLGSTGPKVFGPGVLERAPSMAKDAATGGVACQGRRVRAPDEILSHAPTDSTTLDAAMAAWSRTPKAVPVIAPIPWLNEPTSLSLGASDREPRASVDRTEGRATGIGTGGCKHRPAGQRSAPATASTPGASPPVGLPFRTWRRVSSV